MQKSFVLGAALALLASPAIAQPVQQLAPGMPPSLDQQVEQTQNRMHAAQAEHYLAVAKKFQADLAEVSKQMAAVRAWWGDCVKKAECVAWVNTPPAAAAAAEKPDK